MKNPGYIPRGLLTTNQAKMLKSEGYGYLSAILNLSPATKLPDGRNTCPWAGQCKAVCLQYAGRNRFAEAQRARAARLWLYYNNPDVFVAMLEGEILAHEMRAKANGLKATVRLNGLSDLDWATDYPALFDRFPDVQFIDYTKEFSRIFRDQPNNYHLTYSLNERSPKEAARKIAEETRFNSAFVYSGALPSEYDGLAVISGDEHDLRHLDPRGAVVGLRFKRPIVKGKARDPKSSFVVLC